MGFDKVEQNGQGDIEGGWVILQVKTVVSSGLDWRAGYPRSGIRWFLGACDRGHSGALALCLHGCRELVRVPGASAHAQCLRRKTNSSRSTSSDLEAIAGRSRLSWSRGHVRGHVAVQRLSCALGGNSRTRCPVRRTMPGSVIGPRWRTKGWVGPEAESAGGGGLTDGVGSI